MKRKPHPPPKPRPVLDAPTAPARAVNSTGQRWLFRIAALVLVPLLLLGGLELLLRGAGFGYPTGFFRTIEVDGKPRVVENDKFSWRFFPRRLARRPLPISFNPAKPAEVYRIFVMGESAAMGDPEPSFSFTRVLEVLLRERFPHTQFEVINLAFTAINSHAIWPIAKDCAGYQGDLWVIYMGHNEVHGPFGPGTAFGGHASRLWLTRAALALKATRTGQLLDAARNRLAPSRSVPQTWHGLEMFLEHQFRKGDPRLEAMYGQFQQNLSDIVSRARQNGAEVLLCTTTSNLKDSPPFASLPTPDLPAERKTAFAQAYQAAVASEAAGKCAEALPLLQTSTAADPEFAEAQYLSGRCLLELGRRSEAQEQFQTALDLDTLRFRADSRLNEIVRQTASAWQGRGVYLCETTKELAQGVGDGIPGEELFLDHVHFKFDGNYLLGRAVADQVAARLPAARRSGDAGGWASAEQCANLLGLTQWHEYQMFDILQRRFLEAPFTNQLHHLARRQRFLEQLAQLRPALQPAGLQAAAQLCREAIARVPHDPHLHENLGRVLVVLGEKEAALAEFEKIVRVWPHHAAAYNNIGSLLHQLGRDREAELSFLQALERRSDFPDAHLGLGIVHAARGNIQAAMAQFQEALEHNPEFVEAHLQMAQALQKQGQASAAQRSYETALRIRPEFAPAHLGLADLLLRQGRTFDAIPHLNEAARTQPENTFTRARQIVQAQPNDPLAHFKLANALASLNQATNAAESLQTAVRLKPDFWEARYLLGVELAARGGLNEAQEQFAAVIQQRPDFARAHLNLGVALAQQMRLQEAAAAFSNVLRIEPTNQAARQYLQQINALTNRAVLPQSTSPTP